MIIKNYFTNQANDEWEESKHPRKKNGQFGKGGSSSNSKSPNISGKAATNAIAGVKQGKPMDFQTAMKGVNPNYGKSKKYSENCAACSAVFIARLKGYDLEALPWQKNNLYKVFSAAPNLAFIDPKTGATPNFEYTNAHNGKQLKEWLDKNIKQGGYYMLRYLPDEYANSNHNIIVFKNPKCDLIYYDAQKSEFYNKNFPEDIAYFKWNRKNNKFKSAPPQILRIDDKDLDTKKFELFSKRAKK